MEVLKNASPCPLLMQTELTGLLTLCKLEVSSSAILPLSDCWLILLLRRLRMLVKSKNDLTSTSFRSCKRFAAAFVAGAVSKADRRCVAQFPWSQPETYNSQQVVRLYNTVCGTL